MKKWIIIAAILICCVLYALVKFSKPQGQNEIDQTENPPIEVQADVGEPNNAPSAESPGSVVTPTQVEAVTKVFGEFQSAIKSEDYEQAWKLMSEVVKSGLSFEEFTKGVNVLANAIIHPESATNIEGRVRLLITSPEAELYLFFIQEDGQWKLYNVRPAQNVDTSKE
ncbi:MAG: hypothetical protein ACETWD_06690 [Desulfatiglandales bacterium]